MKKIVLLFLLALPVVGLIAQTSMEKGYVKMEVVEASSDDPQMAMGLEMLKGSTTETYFKKDHYVTKMDMMGGMVSVLNYVNTATNKMDMLMDAMGNKMWIETDMDEAKSMQPSNMKPEDFKIDYDMETTKEIMGYKAFKTTISVPVQDGMTVTGWLTKDIKTDANVIQGMNELKLEGFPLEFTIDSPMMKMTYTTVDIKSEVDESIFEPSTEGYKKMTMEEFTKSMGGMGGLGF